jgi:hypothetical protein
MTMKTRTYRELQRVDGFVERFRYLSLAGHVGASTFGFDRYLNQGFYTSREWRQLRDDVIVRDNGCDLGVEGHEIHHRILVHHMNPINADDVIHSAHSLLNPDNLITTTHRTHNAIHYGDEKLLPRPHVPRERGDTGLWPSIRR